ncbi:hypothetical protein FSP39_015900 [Pinctada imbricata]|uniref:Amino acid transporter n=1 Tax=Pinctada imbricata TaxID=66713 RepID=A0AA88YJT8_PINIB|nr:hypothetical protein FSP39_015900 [Pinctada imbricata]
MLQEKTLADNDEKKCPNVDCSSRSVDRICHRIQCQRKLQPKHYHVDRFTPFGVASLVASSIAQVTDVEDIFRRIGLFVVAHVLAILTQDIIQHPLVFFVIKRNNPFIFLLRCVKPWMTGIPPPSTAMAMPLMITTLEGHHNVDKRVTRFFVPLGAALCRCGSAVFISMAVLFLISLEGKVVTAPHVFLTILVTSVGSLAIPAIPSSSVVVILIILSALDVTTVNIGLLMALEWLNDRVRTTSNIESVMLGGIVVYHFCERNLPSDIKDNGECAANNDDVEMKLRGSDIDSRHVDRDENGGENGMLL